jgi:hypothetical protein
MAPVSKQQRAMVRRIIDAHDETRFAWQGGYPSQVVIDHGTVYWADVDHDGAPELIVMPVARFIKEFKDALE